MFLHLIKHKCLFIITRAPLHVHLHTVTPQLALREREREKGGRKGGKLRENETERERKKQYICEVEKMIIRVKYNPGKQKYINIRVAEFVYLENK